MSKKWNVNEIASAVQSYFNDKKIADPTYSPNTDTISQLIDRIAKVIFVESTNAIDKLGDVITGEELVYGNEIVEYFINMIPVQAFDDFEDSEDYTKTLAPYRPQGDTAYISEKLPRKVFPMSVDASRYDSACVNEGERANLVATFVFKLNQAKELWKYFLKKDALGLYANKLKGVIDATGMASIPAQTELVCGKVYNDNGSTKKYYIMKRNMKTGTSATTFSALVTAGDAVEITLNLVDTTTERPTDNTSGTACIKAFKKAIEDASYFVEGQCISGTACSSDNLTLFILKGYKAEIDTEVLASAFHTDTLGLDARVVEVEDFGADAPTNTWAMLVDTRGIKLHPVINYSREQVNALGDYYTIFSHQQYELFISTHTVGKVFIHN